MLFVCVYFLILNLNVSFYCAAMGFSLVYPFTPFQSEELVYLLFCLQDIHTEYVYAINARMACINFKTKETIE